MPYCVCLPLSSLIFGWLLVLLMSKICRRCEIANRGSPHEAKRLHRRVGSFRIRGSLAGKSAGRHPPSPTLDRRNGPLHWSAIVEGEVCCGPATIRGHGGLGAVVGAHREGRIRRARLGGDAFQAPGDRRESVAFVGRLCSLVAGF